MFNVMQRFIGLNGIARQAVNQQFRNSQRLYSDAPKIEKSLNSVQLLGRVGVDPQRRGSDDNPVVTFSLATATSYKVANGDWLQRTEWHKVVVFKPHLCKTVMAYLTKGQRTLVNGRITYNEINSREGIPKVVTNIVADDVIFLQSSASNQDAE